VELSETVSQWNSTPLPTPLSGGTHNQMLAEWNSLATTATALIYAQVLCGAMLSAVLFLGQFGLPLLPTKSFPPETVQFHFVT